MIPVPYVSQTNQYNSVPSSKIICIPNTKIGIIIGRGGDMLKNLQLESGAKIQIVRGAHDYPIFLTRDVELMGTQEQINRAEQRINEVIAAADLTNSASFGDRSAPPPQAGGEQLVIKVPNDKIGIIIGRGGYMLKNLQLESGAKIQIVRGAHDDPIFLTEDVKLMGTQEQINRAEQRINEVIAAADLTNSASFGDRSAPSPQAGGEQLVIKVPNDKVARVIGKGGESIKAMQSKSGARIQVIPLHCPPGDYSTERNIYINGTMEQIEYAIALVYKVISGNRLKVLSGSNMYQQSGYPPIAAWTPQGQPSAQQPHAYRYSQTGTYAMPQPPYYGGYPPQPTTWDQSAASSQQQNTGYNAYGQGQPPASTPPDVNYNYGQVAPAYKYNQGYPQQPNYGQDGQATPEAKPYAYGPPATSSQPDGSAAVQTSQQGYETPAASGSDGTAQSQPPSGYGQPLPHGNGYRAYPSYSGAPAIQPYYNQTGYAQASYIQQQEVQVASQASYPYYGQSGYPSSQARYYHSAYPSAIPPAQEPPHIQPQTSDNVDSSNVAGAAAEESEDPQWKFTTLLEYIERL
ncbi:uncharacterized protein LOC125491589 isoform X2 [Beta vulgaris subsp. vulgaris]|uniref:uncharacterized protein LOC125491589 isoform X2 n=1 Tax=Beta vulgaris subsp. vulgaris TaxID=3555 RepID=UPI002546FE98|nr:uncharacterized protein LOC125491589 isoform X2 [Beta vulgaris subsp. vulgaris]